MSTDELPSHAVQVCLRATDEAKMGALGLLP
jgi:hypothetical protein